MTESAISSGKYIKVVLKGEKNLYFLMHSFLGYLHLLSLQNKNILPQLLTADYFQTNIQKQYLPYKSFYPSNIDVNRTGAWPKGKTVLFYFSASVTPSYSNAFPSSCYMHILLRLFSQANALKKN